MLTYSSSNRPSPQQITPSGFPQIAGPPASRQIEAIGVPMLFKRNNEVYGQGEPCEYLYRVVKGAVRSYRILADSHHRDAPPRHQASQPARACPARRRGCA